LIVGRLLRKFDLQVEAFVGIAPVLGSLTSNPTHNALILGNRTREQVVISVNALLEFVVLHNH